MVTKQILINNSISGVCQLVITALLTFFCIPIFINKLGTELYGVFAIVSVIGNLNIFTNLGLDSSLTKFIAEQGKNENSNKDIIASIVVTLCIVIPISVLALYFRQNLLIDLLKVPMEYYSQAEKLYCFLLIANAILLVGQTFTAILNGIHKIYLTNFIQLIYSTIYWSGIIIVVLMGYHLDAIGGIILLAATIWLFITITFAYCYWGKITFTGNMRDLRQHANKQVKYGMKLYTSGIIAFFNEPLFKIIISISLGMSAVAYYEIALKIRGQLSGLFQKLFQPLFPYLSQISSPIFTSELIRDLTKKIILLILPVCAILLGTCHDIVTLWLSTDIINYTIFILGIVVPYLLFSSPTLPIYLYLIAKGHPEKTITFQLITVVVNIVTFYLLYYPLGIFSIIVSNGIAYCASFLLGLYYQRKYLNIKYTLNIKKMRNYIALVILYIGICLFQLVTINEIYSILLILFAIFVTTLIAYKHLHIVSSNDILRYFSENKFIISLYHKL